MTALSALFRREIALAWSGGGVFLGVGFFATITLMFPFALGAAPTALASAAPGATWVALILASLLSLDRLFERDLESGALDFLAIGPAPLEAAALIKCLAHWLTSGLPLALISPLGALSLGASGAAALMVLAAAIIGGLAFAMVGGAGAALVLNSRRGGILIALIVLPLLTPPVIFGGAAIERAAGGALYGPSLALLGAYSLAALVIAPLAMAGACRNALS